MTKGKAPTTKIVAPKTKGKTPSTQSKKSSTKAVKSPCRPIVKIDKKEIVHSRRMKCSTMCPHKTKTDEKEADGKIQKQGAEFVRKKKNAWKKTWKQSDLKSGKNASVSLKGIWHSREERKS